METAVAILNEGQAIRAILHSPARPNGRGVVFLHGWPGNRIGPHRMFVTQARRLADLGFHGLRIDFRGRGESDGPTADATIRSMIADAVRAVDYMAGLPGVDRVYVLGICSGGKVAIGAAAGNPRVHGLALWSAEAMGPLRRRATDRRKTAAALRVYAKKLLSLETWRKILTGRVHTRLVRKALATDERPDEAEARHEAALLERFQSFRGRLLFVYGGNDPDTKYAAAGYAAFCARRRLAHEMHEIAEANHSFYALHWEREVMAHTERWFQAEPARPGAR